jgi:hypothetical protein
MMVAAATVQGGADQHGMSKLRLRCQLLRGGGLQGRRAMAVPAAAGAAATALTWPSLQLPQPYTTPSRRRKIVWCWPPATRSMSFPSRALMRVGTARSSYVPDGTNTVQHPHDQLVSRSGPLNHTQHAHRARLPDPAYKHCLLRQPLRHNT